MALPSSEPQAAPLHPPLCLAFSGAGLHGFYFNGICQYLYEKNIEVKEAWGASAGALAALSVLMNVGPEGYEAVFSAYDKHYTHMPWIIWHGRDFVWEGGGGIRRFMPTGEEAEKKFLQEVVNGRLHVVVTKLVGFCKVERVVVSHWDTVEDLIGCIRATMTLPGVTATWPFKWRDAYWVDGGLVDTHPSTATSLLVSTSLPMQPWAASWHCHVDICRPMPVRLSWWHCSVSERRDMFKLGFMDAKGYFEAKPQRQELGKPLRPKVRAMLFLMKIILETLQGSFIMTLIAGFISRRQPPLQYFLSTTLGKVFAPCFRKLGLVPAPSGGRWGPWRNRLCVGAQFAALTVASMFVWNSAMDMRLDLSDHMLELADEGAKKRPQLPSCSGQQQDEAVAVHSSRSCSWPRSQSRRAQSA